MRFALRVDGERISDVEYRDGYTERGVIDRLTRSSLPQALQLITHICPQDALAHALAFSNALEQIGGISVGERGQHLRMIAAEVERATVHIAALNNVHQALGLEQDAETLRRLEHALHEVMHNLTGAAIRPNYIVPGGVRQNLSDEQREKMSVHLRRVERLVFRFIDRFIDHRGILRRTVGVGVLPREAGEQFGVRGPVARASGIPYDARLDRPYALYATYQPSRNTQSAGDVYSRLATMALETLESLKMAIRLLSNLPQDEWQGNAPTSVAEGSATATVESARGTLRYTVQSNGIRLSSVRIDAPRQFDRLLARTFLVGSAIDNAGLIIASTSPCPACAEA